MGIVIMHVPANFELCSSHSRDQKTLLVSACGLPSWKAYLIKQTRCLPYSSQTLARSNFTKSLLLRHYVLSNRAKMVTFHRNVFRADGMAKIFSMR
jgi:hypothetical protein